MRVLSNVVKGGRRVTAGVLCSALFVARFTQLEPAVHLPTVQDPAGCVLTPGALAYAVVHQLFVHLPWCRSM